jgi:ATP-binding protein involved in chromosome partitioning
MPSPPREQVLQALADVRLDGLAKDLTAAGILGDPEISGGRVRLTLDLPSPGHPRAEELAAAVRERGAAIAGVEQVDVKTTWTVRPGDTRRPGLPGIRQVIAVASGKGGVGKSTVAVNLAAGLRSFGAQVGLLDLDIYGPSVPLVLGNDEEPQVHGQRLVASEAHGIRFLSMGQLARGDSPVVWRGPMLHKMVMQFTEADWGELDYLILDLPPGTGDVQLSVTQQLPLAGAIIVTTPQEIALIDARKGLRMFQDVRTPILGLVENMAYYRCRKCGKEHAVFGRDGGARLAEAENVPLLARIPIDPSVSGSQDAGKPLALSDESESGRAFRAMAAQAAAAAGLRSLQKNPFQVLT